MSAKRAGHRGFIMLIALAVFAIVGTAMLSLAVAINYEGNRAVNQARQTQLEQLLLAGQASAASRLSADSLKPGDEWDVSLPAMLASADGTLTVRVKSADESTSTLDVFAKLSGEQAQQRLRFHRSDNRWELAGADISGVEDGKN